MVSVAGRGWISNDRSIDVLVGELRKKFEEDPNCPSLIKTIRGAGYKFTARI
ncbi:MAG: DNA-binding response OmpR family regulator [Pseudohongiellaceae bacterium]|jgi:DNA-binding response OmpR family regulator